VAMMVLLLDDADGVFAVREDEISELARLGVTSVHVLRNERLVGVVLEGWLFDPARSSRAAAEAVGTKTVRTLRPLMHMAVPATSQGGRDGGKSSYT
jgi:hypothetical protein